MPSARDDECRWGDIYLGIMANLSGQSDEDFIQHYNHKHAQMAAPVLEKHKVITYSLVRPPNFSNNNISSVAGISHP